MILLLQAWCLRPQWRCYVQRFQGGMHIEAPLESTIHFVED